MPFFGSVTRLVVLWLMVLLLLLPSWFSVSVSSVDL